MHERHIVGKEFLSTNYGHTAACVLRMSDGTAVSGDDIPAPAHMRGLWQYEWMAQTIQSAMAKLKQDPNITQPAAPAQPQPAAG